jgi:hypothetical protein
MTDHARDLLAALRSVGAEAMEDVYILSRADVGDDGVPFDIAYYDWLDAGCPDPLPSETELARALRAVLLAWETPPTDDGEWPAMDAALAQAATVMGVTR